MSIAAGVFSETSLVNIQAKMDAIWADAIKKQDYVANVGPVLSILNNQTATFGNLLTGPKDRTVDIGFINECEITDDACTVCAIDGTELSTNIKQIELETCRESSFKVEEGIFHKNLFDAQEVMAKGFLAAAKALDEFWANTLVAFLNTNKGVNVVTDGKGNVSGTDTYILPAFWDAGLMAYFARVAARNQFVNPFMVSGNNLYEQVWNANYERGQSGDQSKALKFGSMPIDFDLFNIDAVNSPDLISYLIHKGSIAFTTKNYYGAGVTKYMDQHRWSIPSMNIPGVRYDVHYQDSCESQGTYDFMTYQFKLKTLGDFFLNPVGCTETKTGILTFVCGEVPAE